MTRTDDNADRLNALEIAHASQKEIIKGLVEWRASMNRYVLLIACGAVGIIATKVIGIAIP